MPVIEQRRRRGAEGVGEFVAPSFGSTLPFSSWERYGTGRPTHSDTSARVAPFWRRAKRMRVRGQGDRSQPSTQRLAELLFANTNNNETKRHVVLSGSHRHHQGVPTAVDLRQRVAITDHPVASEVLTDDVVAFPVGLHERFGPCRAELLSRHQATAARYRAGERPDVRRRNRLHPANDWHIALPCAISSTAAPNSSAWSRDRRSSRVSTPARRSIWPTLRTRSRRSGQRSSTASATSPTPTPAPSTPRSVARPESPTPTMRRSWSAPVIGTSKKRTCNRR